MGEISMIQCHFFRDMMTANTISIRLYVYSMYTKYA